MRVVAIAMIGFLCFLAYQTTLEKYHARQLRQLGATVSYGYKAGCVAHLDPNLSATEFLRRAPASLRVLSRYNRFGRSSVSLYLDDTDVSDDDLKNLQDIGCPLFVSLKNTNMSDKGLGILADLDAIGGSSLENTKVSETALNEYWKSHGYRRKPDGKLEKIER